MTDDAVPGRSDDGIDARERARTRRRDRDADAEARDLMRPGMGKVFKQIRDAQAKAAKAPAPTDKPKRS
jgi:3,4-dihydroxy-2-butanone 4-phosphate synthase